MDIKELKKLIKECVHEVVQEDDFISKLIIESYKAASVINSISLNESPVRKQEQKQTVPKKQVQEKPSDKDIWKKIIAAKRPSVDEIGESMDDFGAEISLLEKPAVSAKSKPQQELTSISQLLETAPIVDEGVVEVKEDKELMSFFAKKFKRS